MLSTGSYILGPGLAIRVLCTEQPYIENDFAGTKSILKTIVNYHEACKKVSVGLNLFLRFCLLLMGAVNESTLSF